MATLRQLEQRATRHLETARGWHLLHAVAVSSAVVPARVAEECARKLRRAKVRCRAAQDALQRAIDGKGT